MSKYQEVREKLWEEIRAGGPIEGGAIQKRPYTVVFLMAKDDDDNEVGVGVGFAKVHYVDKWNPEYGIWMALQKAVASLAKQMAGKEEYVEYSNKLFESPTEEYTFTEGGVPEKFLDVEL